jgi:probable F420-dependent oxidoreductase
MAVFSLQAVPKDAADWLDVARRADAAGFDALLTPDHPGACSSPFVALAAAAAVTTRIKLGSYVSNAGVREPILLAADVATLDVVSGGRALLGIGAGHTPAEWAAVGRTRPDVRGRVERCIAVAEATRRLLDGEEVTVDSAQLRMTAAKLDEPRPVQAHVPLLFGGGNRRLLAWAAENADIIGLSGLGRTLPDGHLHEVRWRTEEIDEQVGALQGRPLEALVQHIDISDDPEPALMERFGDTGLTADELRRSPYVLAGTEDEIVAAVREHRRRWGITRYAVRAPALDLLPPLLPRLAAEAG